MNKPPSQAQAAAEIDAWMATLQQPVLRDLKGITDEEMEALYALAYHHYQAGHRQEALQRFKLLVTLDPLEQRFWLGLGGAAQRLYAVVYYEHKVYNSRKARWLLAGLGK